MKRNPLFEHGWRWGRPVFLSNGHIRWIDSAFARSGYVSVVNWQTFRNDSRLRDHPLHPRQLQAYVWPADRWGRV